jgi:gluconokinase
VIAGATTATGTAPGTTTATVPASEASVVVMGVAGCGKSSVAEALARSLGWAMVEGDRFHGDANRARMAAGVALSDGDRQHWLAALGVELAATPTRTLLTCSALKRRYRDQLRAALPAVRFIFLDVTIEESRRRVAARAGHFFNPALVANQFETLERPDGEAGVLRLDATQPLPLICQRVADWL